jgi:hypothetical protein
MMKKLEKLTGIQEKHEARPLRLLKLKPIKLNISCCELQLRSRYSVP